MKNNINIVGKTSLIMVMMGLVLTMNTLYSQSALPNNSLHFDGENDCVQLNNIKCLDLDFTVQMRFKADADGITGNFRRLFSMLGTTNFGFTGVLIELGKKDNDLLLHIETVNSPPFGIEPPFWKPSTYKIVIPGALQIDEWYCIALVRSSNILKVYLNGEEKQLFSNGASFNEITLPGFALPISSFQLGVRFMVGIGLVQPSTEKTLYWKGEIDDVRIYNLALENTELSTLCEPCLPDYWDFMFYQNDNRLNTFWAFDDAINPGGNNVGKHDVQDWSGNNSCNNPGALRGFALQGNRSNFIKSTAYVDLYANYYIRIKEASGINTLTIDDAICSGDPVYFEILHYPDNATPPPTSVKTEIEWWYCDGMCSWGWWGLSSWWKRIPPNPEQGFDVFSFPSVRGHMATTANCDGTLSEVERHYVAVIKMIDNNYPYECEFVAQTIDPLRICCPVEGLELSFDPYAEVYCEGLAPYQFNLNLSINLPYPSSSNSVSIFWSYSFTDINGVTTTVSLPTNNNQHQIVFPDPPLGLSAGKYCLTATVSNCGCETKTITKCITIEAPPVCGSITGVLNNLIPTSDPNFFNICPGDDATLTISSPFSNCLKQWEYKFTSEGTWNSLGSSNASQNTNILPHLKPSNSPYLWPVNETCIVYRIKCLPLSYPNSGCDPCYSNEVTICLVEGPVKPEIIGLSPICDGYSAYLYTSPSYEDSDYNWYLDGKHLPGETDPWIYASQQGNYVFTVTEPVCGLTSSSDPFYLQLCTVIAVISCPDPLCPCPGDEITISGADSYSTCDGPLIYEWYYWDGGELVFKTGSPIVHIPEVDGTTYTLIVTDEHGCQGTTQRTFAPCPERLFVCGEPFVDKRDGHKYQTVQICEQCWMAENLNVGAMISGSSNQTNNTTTEKYCYNNIEANCNIFGGLYQWDEMMQYSTSAIVQGICPVGWHVPETSEHVILYSCINDNPDFQCNEIPEFIAKSLAAKTLWNSSTTLCAVGKIQADNNATGYNGYPGGYRSNTGLFSSMSNMSTWWSSSIESTANSWYLSLYYNNPDINRWYINKNQGFSVRCIRDL